MSTDISFLFTHTLDVEPLLGVDSTGANVYGPTVTVACFIDRKRRLVRSPTTGEQSISEATVYCAVGALAGVPLGSRATDPRDGRVADVLAVAQHDLPGYPTPDHLEITLT